MINIRTLRAGEGLETDIAQQVYDRYKAGDDLVDSIKGAMVQLAVDRFRPKIEAAMRAAGLQIADGQELTADTLVQAIKEKTGLELESLTPEGIADALDARIARELSTALGVEVSSVKNLENLKAELLASAVRSVQSGRASALMTAHVIKRVRAVSTWSKAGVEVPDRVKTMGALYQKRYRRTHRQVWDKISYRPGS